MELNLDTKTYIPSVSYDYFNNISANPIILIIIFIILILYYLLFSSLGRNNSDIGYENTKSASSVLLEIILWAIFVTLILLNGIYFLFDINVIASLKNLFTGVPEIDVKVKSSHDFLKDGSYNNINEKLPKLDMSIDEVFHIRGNNYTYNDAKAVCKAFGGKLATYEELEKAYEKGADWCEYGWSDNQMAYFPTQLSKWKKLQKEKGKENYCGRPGINGGYIANKNVKFGINCFGKKPEMNKNEYDLMINTPNIPKTKEEIEFENNVNNWKKRIKDLLVSPFNNKQWNMPISFL
jgi:heme/copper-type cytochrome/quinol oxidase subunit 2